MSSRQIRLYSTPPHECSYLPERTAVNAVVDPEFDLTSDTYARLIDAGFRRSGNHLYAPHCPDCSACKTSRVPVTEFIPNRSQRRCIRNNADLSVHVRAASYSEEYFDLYERYLQSRHRAGGMDDPTPDKFTDFLIAEWCDTRFIEYRLNDKLLSVSVVDVFPQGYSAVYTFFDPAEQKRGLGTLAPLWLIRQAGKHGLPWVYLGYWIDNCDKMSYKANYRPLQILNEGAWQSLEI